MHDQLTFALLFETAPLTYLFAESFAFAFFAPSSRDVSNLRSDIVLNFSSVLLIIFRAWKWPTTKLFIAIKSILWLRFFNTLTDFVLITKKRRKVSLIDRCIWKETEEEENVFFSFWYWIRIQPNHFLSWRSYSRSNSKRFLQMISDKRRKRGENRSKVEILKSYFNYFMMERTMM